MFGIGPAELGVVVLLGLSLFSPLGIPPLPPDAITLQSAPQECLFFAASAGTAKPDETSENHTDQLLSTKEMQSFLSQFAAQFNGAIEQFSQNNKPMQPFIKNGKPLVETLLSRPAAIYIDRIEMMPGKPPSVVAGLVVNCGNRKADVATAVEALEKKATADGGTVDDIKDAKVAGITLRRSSPAPGVEIHWGFKGDYFVATIGEGAAAELLSRLGGTAAKPRWMTALEKQAGVKRVSTIRYLDVARLIATAAPTFPRDGFDVPGLLDAVGVGDLTSVGGVAGFSTRGMVDRTIANFKGPPKGLFELLAGKAITADDLKPVPSTAVFAVALRLDLVKVYQKLLGLADKMDPKGVQNFKQTVSGLAQAFGFRLEEDILGSFGDVWTVHNTIASGPDQLSGLVATVTLKNKEMVLKVQSLVLGMTQAKSLQLPFTIAEAKIGDVPAWKIVPAQTGAPSPAWTIAGDRLVVGGSFEALKTQLGQGAGSAGLAELPAVASRLKTDPVFVTYQDTKTLVEQWIGLIQAFGPIGTAALAQQGIKVDIPQLPEFKVIAAHVLPRTSTLRISKQTIVSEAFETVPLVGSSLSAAPVAGVSVALLLPAIQAARDAARSNQSITNLNSINLAVFQERNAHGRFPGAICDKSGKPLLSWRVAVLPYLDEKELYDQFRLDEPWDSEHNKPLLEKMPAVYSNPRLDNLGGKTVYLVPTGKETIFFDNKGATPEQITDGMNKTILIVEADAEHAVHWTKPGDLAIDKEKPAAGLARRPTNGQFLVARADGASTYLPGDIDPATLWSLFTRAGGEPIPWPGEESPAEPAVP